MKKIIYLSLILILFFTSPYLVLLSQRGLSLDLLNEDFLWALKNTLWQALGSATVSVGLGFLGALGLLWASRVFPRWVYVGLVHFSFLPSFLPSLFVVTAALGLFDPFPFGRIGIVVIHAMIHVGLVSVLLNEIFHRKLQSLGALCLVEGASRFQFLRTAVFGALRSDLIYLFLFVFAVSILSFNIPLMVGGSSGTTLEVLIYEKFLIDRDWAVATGLSLLQVLLVAFVSQWARNPFHSVNTVKQEATLSLAEFRYGLLIPLGASFSVVLPPLLALKKGMIQLGSIGLNFRDFLNPIYQSLVLGFSVGLLTLVLALCSVLAFPWKGWRRFMLLYLPPGPVLIGMAISILPLSLPLLSQLVIGFCLLSFASLYRLVLASPLSGLVAQIETAQVLGAKPSKIFWDLLLPQVIKPLFFVCGLGSLWASGDFALSSVLSINDLHLALWIKKLAASYRIDAAQSLTLVLYGVSFMGFIFWWRLGDVLSRKLNR